MTTCRMSVYFTDTGTVGFQKFMSCLPGPGALNYCMHYFSSEKCCVYFCLTHSSMYLDVGFEILDLKFYELKLWELTVGRLSYVLSVGFLLFSTPYLNFTGINWNFATEFHRDLTGVSPQLTALCARARSCKPSLPFLIMLVKMIIILLIVIMIMIIIITTIMCMMVIVMMFIIIMLSTHSCNRNGNGNGNNHC